MILVNDPILSIDVAVSELILIVKRRLKSLLPISAEARPFLCMDPEAGLNNPIPIITRIRARHLAAADRAIEARIFPSASTDTKSPDSGRQISAQQLI